MKKTPLLLAAAALLTLLGTSGCGGYHHAYVNPAPHPAPPPHAPAHGYRAKYQYYYYPSSYVYYYPASGIYFYLSGSRWVESHSLPIGVVIDIRERVILDLDTDKPYIYHHEHKKRYKPKKGGPKN